MFTLSVDLPLVGDKVEEFVVDASRGEKEPYYWHDYALEYDGPGTGSWSSTDRVKWYDAMRDVKELSTHFPGTLFTLMGEGEESDDRWTFYARNGTAYTAYIEFIYPVFDEAKLA